MPKPHGGDFDEQALHIPSKKDGGTVSPSTIVQNPKYPEIVCIRAVTPLEGFKMHVTFTDGTERDIDLDPYLGTGSMFAPIRNDLALFRQVYVDPETETLTWPNGADIAPETLYYEGEPPWATEGKSSRSRPRPRSVRSKTASRPRARARTKA